MSVETERKSHKDWFDSAAARQLAVQVGDAWPEFNQAAFVRRATRNLNTKEFSGRVQQFSDALRAELPDDIPQALNILTQSLPAPLPDCDSVTDGWLQWPVGQFIADHGIEHLDASMNAMVELTQRFSAEYAIRPFAERYPQSVFERLMKLTQHPSPHVRRWCSEGVRPRLPWGKTLTFLCKDPAPLWPILDVLCRDDELYVRRSVANNLNDIAKDHPQFVVERCRQWARSPDPNIDWVINHGLRSLVKAGDRAALAAIGYAEPRAIDVRFSVEPSRVNLGDKLELHATLSSTHDRAQKVMVDYVVHYVRKNGATSQKVFKWTGIDLDADSEIELSKKHSMRVTSIRALYPGKHKVEIQINGHRLGEATFYLNE